MNTRSANINSANSSSNIQLVTFKLNDLGIPDGCIIEKEPVNGKMDGPIRIIDKCGALFAKLQFNNDKLNGLCLFFKSGLVIKKVMYHDGVPHGWSCDCKMGKEVKWYLYEKGKKKSELVKSQTKPGFWEELDLKDQSLRSYCQFNNNHKRHNMSYLYKEKSIDKIVMFADGEKVQIMKEFNDSIMTEYDQDGNMVYEGCYLNSLADDFPRHGEGKEFQNQLLAYDGHWEKDKRHGEGYSLKGGSAFYVGNWKDNLPGGEGSILNDEASVVYKGQWEQGRLHVKGNSFYDFLSESIIEILSGTISKEDDWYSLSKEVGELEVGEGVCNEMKSDLKICDYPRLWRICVKKDSLKNLNSLVIAQNDALREIVVEERAFYNVKNVTIRGRVFRC